MILDSGQIAGGARVLDGSGDHVAVRLTPIPVPGDVDCDQLVNVNHLLQVIHRWHETGGPADLNHDGIVNALDLIIVIENWSF